MKVILNRIIIHYTRNRKRKTKKAIKIEKAYKINELKITLKMEDARLKLFRLPNTIYVKT